MRLNPLMATRVIAALSLAGSLIGAPALAQSAPQTPPPPAPPATQTQTPTQTPTRLATQSQDPQDPDDPNLPIDLARMRKRLNNPSPTKIDDGKVRFTLEVIARQATMKDFIGKDESLKYGAVKGSVMSHQEFLDMVNPKLLNSSAGFTATETLQGALFNWAVQAAVKKGVTALKNARNQSEVNAIRAQIDRELTALRGGGQ